jgi:site-specific DNA recombinase
MIVSKQAIIYCRFSPRPDADESKSNEKQEERCCAFCARQGHEIARVFKDRAITGKLLDRPELQKAIDSLEPGMVFVVDTGDRLARDMLVALTLHHQIEKRGATVETADGSPTRTTPEGRLFTNILAAFAQYERERFARRTKAGLAKKKANGEWLGRPPLGYQVISKRLVENQVEQMAIRQIRIYGEAGQPSQWIAWKINEQLGPCRGKPWSARTVRKILAS